MQSDFSPEYRVSVYCRAPEVANTGQRPAHFLLPPGGNTEGEYVEKYFGRDRIHSDGGQLKDALFLVVVSLSDVDARR